MVFGSIFPKCSNAAVVMLQQLDKGLGSEVLL